MPKRKTTKQPQQPAVEPVAEAVTARPATIPELRAALPGADAEFILSQIEAFATVETAIPVWIAELNTRNQKLQQELAAVSSGKR